MLAPFAEGVTLLAHGIHRVSTDHLKRLLRALHRGALASPVTRASLIEKGFGDLEVHLDLIVGRDRPSAQAVVVAVLQERAAWERKVARGG
jgi:hypothetical protein